MKKSSAKLASTIEATIEDARFALQLVRSSDPDDRRTLLETAPDLARSFGNLAYHFRTLKPRKLRAES